MITSVYIDTDELVFQLHSVSDDAQKALEWVRAFRDTLMFGARIPNPLPFAMECMAMSEGFSASGVLGKLRAAARKRLNDEGVESTPESIDAEITRTQGADAVREIMAKIERANSLKAEIRRRKFTAAAATREGVDVVQGRESGSLVRTTGCNQLTADGDIREDSLNIRYTGDRGTLESGTSANHYDQETTTAGKLATGSSHPAPETGTAYGRPQERPERACWMGSGTPEPQGGPKSGNIYDQETNASTEALDKPGAGGKTPEIERISASLPAPSPARPAKKAHGEFGNVMLTDDEYAKLCERFSIADTVIEEADQYFEAQPAKKKKYKSHYAMLLNWCKRKETEAKPQQRYKNINDINQENYEKAMREIEAMCAGEAV